jgi:hypothetical protein
VEAGAMITSSCSACKFAERFQWRFTGKKGGKSEGEDGAPFTVNKAEG